MQVPCAHFFLTNPTNTRPDNTAWVRRFPPKTSAVVTLTLPTPIFYLRETYVGELNCVQFVRPPCTVGLKIKLLPLQHSKLCS
jgi:hypothetical protein